MAYIDLGEILSDDDLDKLVTAFAHRVDTFDLKETSKRVLTMQGDFFVGAMIGMNKQHTGISICIMSGRSILKEFKKYNHYERDSKRS